MVVAGVGLLGPDFVKFVDDAEEFPFASFTKNVEEAFLVLTTEVCLTKEKIFEIFLTSN